MNNTLQSFDRAYARGGVLQRIFALVVGIALASPAHTRSDQSVSEEPGPNLGDLSLDELMGIKVESVYGASRYDQKVTRAPSSVSIVTADEIRKLGYRTLAEVLRGVRGLYVSDDRNYSYLGIRGFLRPNGFNSRVLVLVDGHRMNDNLYDSGTVAREGMVDIAMIDRVEVIRGPSSSIYGSSAFFGVINVVTRRGGQVDGVELSTEVATFDTYKSSVNLGSRSANGFEWLFSAANYDSGGAPRLYFSEFDQRISSNERASHDGIAAGIDGERAFNLFGSVGYGDLAVAAFFSDRVKRVPTASFGTIFNDRREETTDYRGYVDIKFDHDFSASLNLKGRLFYDNLTAHATYPYGTLDAGQLQDEYVFQYGTVGEWVGTQWQLTARLLDRHTVIVGGEYRNNVREYQSGYIDVEPRLYVVRDDRSSQTFGVFAQDEFALRKNLLLIAGLRYDYYVDSFGGTTSPRLGLIYSPWDTTTFKALVGAAYRAPNPYERLYSGVKPERIKTYELVAERYIGAHYRLNASVYYYDIRGLISQTGTPDEGVYFANLQSAEAIGTELEAQAKLDSGLTMRASFALQRAEDGQMHRDLSSSPRHLGKLSLIVPLAQDKVFGGLDLQYNGASDAPSGERVAQFVTANLTVYTQKLIQNLSLSFNVYNLLDKEYGYPAAGDHDQDVIDMDGRSFRGAAVYKF